MRLFIMSQVVSNAWGIYHEISPQSRTLALRNMFFWTDCAGLAILLVIAIACFCEWMFGRCAFYP